MTQLPALNEFFKALVIHSRCLIASNLVNQFTPGNTCLECTILHGEGTEHPSYTQQLFKIACVTACVMQSKSSLILSQLEVSALPEEFVHQSLSRDATTGCRVGALLCIPTIDDTKEIGGVIQQWVVEDEA
jgi:hypothetical protein